MCFIEKKNCIWIRKREDHVPDPVWPPDRIGHEGTSPHNAGHQLQGSRS